MNTIKTKIIELPTFEQLNEDEKVKVIENYYDINVDDSFWYEHIKNEANELGFNITEFDIDRGNYIKTRFHSSEVDVAKAIIANHGKDCETYKTAKLYLDNVNDVYSKYSKVFDEDGYCPEYEGEVQVLDSEFRKDIAQDYLTMLRKEYEYQTSDENIAEILTINEYTFNRETLKIDS